MKHLKKIFAAALALFMALAVVTPALAETTVTINPNKPDGSTSNPTYTYYVMMKASVSENGTAYYVENETLASALNGLKVGNDDLFTVTKASGANRWNVTINKKADQSAFTGEEVAAALYSIKSNAIATGEAVNNKITLDDDAYLLIESSLGTKLVLDTVTITDINEKNTYPSLTKTEDRENAEIGGTVNYTIPVVIPATVAEKDITVYDVISKGLTLNTAITANQGVTGLKWSLVDTADNGAKTYSVVIPAATVKANAGNTITLTYSATLNELAVVNVPETNKARLVYDEYNSVETPEVEVVNFGFDLNKTDGSNALAGVKFTLTNAAGLYYTPGTDEDNIDEARFLKAENEVITDADGVITFAGLEAGTYILTETETLDGFNLLTSPIEVTMGDDGQATFSGEGISATGNTLTVVNNAGTALPSTGGIGTTLFYVIGGILVAGAAIALVVKNRVAKIEE